MKKDRIYVVSRYLGKYKNQKRFHFIGYFKGIRIKEIQVRGGEYIMEEDYVLALKNISIKGNILSAELIRSKRIFT